MIEKATGHKRPLSCHHKGLEEFVDSSYPGNWSSSASLPYFSCRAQWLWSIKFHRNWPPIYSKICSCHRLLHQIHCQKLYVFQDYRSRWNHHLIRVKTTFVQGRARDVHDVWPQSFTIRTPRPFRKVYHTHLHLLLVAQSYVVCSCDDTASLKTERDQT